MKTTESLMACNQLNRCEERNDADEKFQSIILPTQSENISSFCLRGTKASQTSDFSVILPAAGESVLAALLLHKKDSATQNHHKIDKTPFYHPVTTSFRPALLHLRSKEPDCANIPLYWYQSFHRLWGIIARKGDFEANLFSLHFHLPRPVPSEHKLDRQQIIATWVMK